LVRRIPAPAPFPYTTLFRSVRAGARNDRRAVARRSVEELLLAPRRDVLSRHAGVGGGHRPPARRVRPQLAVSDGGGHPRGDLDGRSVFRRPEVLPTRY